MKDLLAGGSLFIGGMLLINAAAFAKLIPALGMICVGLGLVLIVRSLLKRKEG